MAVLDLATTQLDEASFLGAGVEHQVEVRIDEADPCVDHAAWDVVLEVRMGMAYRVRHSGEVAHFVST